MTTKQKINENQEMIVQIYGVTTPEDGIAVASLGVNRIGLVLCEDESLTHDGVSDEMALEIISVLPKGVSVSGLSFSTDPEELEDMVKKIKPDILHLTMTPDLFPIDAIQKLKNKIPGVEIMQAVPVKGPETIDLALLFERVVDVILLDTPRDDGSDALGATGRTNDWSIGRQIVQKCKIPVILAGGLHPGNVYQAIQTVKPWGVDSSTLTSKPENMRRKDLELVKRFIEEARRK